MVYSNRPLPKPRPGELEAIGESIRRRRLVTVLDLLVGSDREEAVRIIRAAMALHGITREEIER